MPISLQTGKQKEDVADENFICRQASRKRTLQMCDFQEVRDIAKRWVAQEIWSWIGKALGMGWV